MVTSPLRRGGRAISRRACARLAATLLFAMVGAAAAAQENDADAAAFQQFLGALRTEAADQGIGAATLDAVFPTIRPHRQALVEDRNQAEFVVTYERYLRRVSPTRIARGREFLATHAETLQEVATAYGVQPRFIVAILGLESDYGTYPITEPLFDVVATLAYDARRGAQFRAQFIAGLRMVDNGYATVAQMKSSWAGALGVPQFTPTNVLRLGVDHNRDGAIDLWNAGPDVFASVANYLRDTGWRNDQTWGREVLLPSSWGDAPPASTEPGLTPNPTCRSYESLGTWRGLADWQQLGARRTDGAALPARNLPAAFIAGDAGDNRGYLVYRNFCSIMRYNPAFRYALAVGLLADAVAARDTPRP